MKKTAALLILAFGFGTFASFSHADYFPNVGTFSIVDDEVQFLLGWTSDPGFPEDGNSIEIEHTFYGECLEIDWFPDEELYFTESGANLVTAGAGFPGPITFPGAYEDCSENLFEWDNQSCFFTSTPASFHTVGTLNPPILEQGLAYNIAYRFSYGETIIGNERSDIQLAMQISDPEIEWDWVPDCWHALWYKRETLPLAWDDDVSYARGTDFQAHGNIQVPLALWRFTQTSQGWSEQNFLGWSFGRSEHLDKEFDIHLAVWHLQPSADPAIISPELKTIIDKETNGEQFRVSFDSETFRGVEVQMLRTESPETLFTQARLYVDYGQGFNEDDAVFFQHITFTSKPNERYIYRAYFPLFSSPIKRIRIDPVPNDGGTGHDSEYGDIEISYVRFLPEPKKNFTQTTPTTPLTLITEEEAEPDPTLYHLQWPFPNSSYVDPDSGTNDWYVSCGPGCGYHLGGDYYADDWSLPGDADCNLDFYSPVNGTVIFTGEGAETGYGNQVVIQTLENSKLAFRVAHFNKVTVSNGQQVTTGTKIGEIGSTGTSSGCHAHNVLYQNIDQIYTGNQTGLDRLKTGDDLGLSGGANGFAAPYYFDAGNACSSSSCGILSAPVGIVATGGEYTDKVRITWNAVSGASSYIVYRATSPTGTKSTLASGVAMTQYDDTTGEIGKVYYYWVIASNSYGTSDYSNYDAGWRYDTISPTITINSPTSNPSYTTTTSPLSLSGTASDNVGLLSVSWFNDREGLWKVADGTTNWTAKDIYLYSGTNVITVRVRDQESNPGDDTITVTYTPLTCTPPGSGDWTINSSCEMSGSQTAHANVIVKPNAVLTITDGALLNIDMKNYHLLVEKDGGVLIRKDGKIY